jgi:hypothetical protein
MLLRLKNPPERPRTYMPRPRKTLAQLRASGTLAANPGRYAQRVNATPLPTNKLKVPPKYFDVEEKRTWMAIVDAAPQGALANSDVFAIELTTKLLCKLRNSLALPRPSELTLLLNALSRLGLTPADRAKLDIVAPEPEKKENDPWDELLSM